MDKIIDDLLSMDYRRFKDLAISPDEQDLLLVFGTLDGPHDSYMIDEQDRSIWKFDLATREITQLVSSAEDACYPRWSPDGQKIAYLSRRSGQKEIWIMDRDGHDKQQLTKTTFDAENPFERSSICWSPSGIFIAYTVLPNGSEYLPRIRLMQEFRGVYKDADTRILVHGPQVDEKFREAMNELLPPERRELHLLDMRTGECNRVHSSANPIQIIDWFSDEARILIKAGRNYSELNTTTGEVRSLFAPQGAHLVRLESDGLRVACLTETQVKVGIVNDGEFIAETTMEIPKAYCNYSLQLCSWSQDGTRLFGGYHRGVSQHIFFIDLESGKVEDVTFLGQWAKPNEIVCLREDRCIMFPCSGADEPIELWKYTDRSLIKLSYINHEFNPSDYPRAEIVQYESNGQKIEGILMTPPNHVPGKRCPTLIFLHGGPEAWNAASFLELINASGLSVAVYLATRGYAVFLPNFRGSGGYGPEFEDELGNYQMMHAPFQDVMKGVEFLIDKEIADPERLGIYGHSFGAAATAWAVAQTDIFRGAVGTVGIGYDRLSTDRRNGSPFYSLQPNRSKGTDPLALWNNPDVYKDISPMEHVHKIKTPFMLMETGAERRFNSVGEALPFFNALRANNVESYLVYYPQAFHSAGWNARYKRDYMNRLSAWFDHCLLGTELPDWFETLMQS